MTWLMVLRPVTCIGLILATTAAVRAQSPVPPVALPPANVLLSNYNSVTVGEIASLEAGAFVVRANDTSSIFYNPAGVTNAETTAISGSAGVFQWSSVSARQTETPGTAFKQIPAMFAVVVKNLLGRPNWAGGLAVSRVNAWGQEVAVERVFDAGSISDRLSYASEASIDSWIGNIGVGYRAAPRLRIGGSFDAQYTTTTRDALLGDQYRDGTSLSTALISAKSSFWAAHARLTAGAQFDLTPKVQAGAVIRTGGLEVMSSGSAVLEGASRVGSTTTTASFLDTEGSAEYRIPFEVKAGVAYTFARGQIEFDLLTYLGAGVYEGFTSERPLTILTDPGTGVVSAQQVAAVRSVIDSRGVVNVAIGGHYNLTPSGKWTVHGGYATDRSPTGEQDTIFTSVHLQKITIGLSGRTTRFLGSLGVQYASGTSSPVQLRQFTDGERFSTNFDVSTLGLVYSLALLF